MPLMRALHQVVEHRFEAGVGRVEALDAGARVGPRCAAAPMQALEVASSRPGASSVRRGARSTTPSTAISARASRRGSRARIATLRGCDGEQRAHVADRALREQPAAVEQHDVLRQRLDLVQHVARHDDRSARRAPSSRRSVDHLAPPDGIEPGHRLVEHDELGVVRDRLRDLGALAHALAVAARAPVARVAEVDALQRARRARARVARAGEPGQAQQERHELAGRSSSSYSASCCGQNPRRGTGAGWRTARGRARGSSRATGAARRRAASGTSTCPRRSGRAGRRRRGRAERHVRQPDDLAVEAAERSRFDQRASRDDLHASHAATRRRATRQRRTARRRDAPGERQAPLRDAAVRRPNIQVATRALDHERLERQEVAVALEPAPGSRRRRRCIKNQAEHADQRERLRRDARLDTASTTDETSSVHTTAECRPSSRITSPSVFTNDHSGEANVGDDADRRAPARARPERRRTRRS